MIQSRNRTLAVPVIAVAAASVKPPAPAALIRNAGYDCVIKVRNNSFGQFVLLSFDDAALQNVPALPEAYKLPAGAVETFIVAKGQSLYVSTTSGPPEAETAEISFHIYQSLPVDDQIP